MGILTLVRHGQASFGSLNYDELTPLGVAQAAQTGVHFAQRKTTFDRIVSGPLQRQRQTAGAIIRQLPAACDVDVVGALQEFAEPSQILASVANMPGGASHAHAAVSTSERMTHYGGAIQAWANGTLALEGALSSAAFVHLVTDWFDQTVSERRRGSRTLAVTSAGVIAACLVRHFALPASRLSEFASVLQNCSVTEFVFSANRRSLLNFNNTTHLSDALVSAM